MSDLPPPPPSYGAPQFQPPSAGHELSGWWRRVGAAILDFLILFVPFMILLFAVGSPDGGAVAVLVVLFFIGNVAYEVVLHARTGQTVGKMVTGIRVVAKGSPRAPLGYSKSWGRFGAEFGIRFGLGIVSAVGALGGLLSLVGVVLMYLWPLWDSDKQTWYDKAADTIVVRT